MSGKIINLVFVALAPGLCLAGSPGQAPPFGGWVLGRIQPRGAVRLHVPPGSLGARKAQVLLRQVAEGALVRAGDELAAFAFDPEPLRAQAEQDLGRAEARAARSLAERSERILVLEASRELAAIEARKATLEKSKAGVLSKRDAALLELDARLAAFELEAIERRIAGQTALLQAEQAVHAERVTQARERLERVAVLAGRHRLVAPGAGRIHWLASLAAGTRLQPGDPIALLAPGEGSDVTFLVPVDQQAEYRPGRAVTVISLSGDLETFARVTAGTGAMPAPGDRAEAWVELRAELPADASGFVPGQPVRVGP